MEDERVSSTLLLKAGGEEMAIASGVANSSPDGEFPWEIIISVGVVVVVKIDELEERVVGVDLAGVKFSFVPMSALPRTRGVFVCSPASFSVTLIELGIGEARRTLNEAI